MTRPHGSTLAVAYAAALLAVSALAIACSSGGDAQPSTPGGGTQAAGSTNVIPVAAEDALARYVSRLGQGFLADCSKAKRPGDVGKQCATKLGERQGLVAYSLGPTFSPATRILILKPENGDWTLVTILNIDPNLPSAPGIPWPLAVRANVIVAGTGDCLKIREAPGINGFELDCVKDGQTVTVVGGPTTADNIEWWQLKDLGWAAGNYLRYQDAALTPTPSPQP